MENRQLLEMAAKAAGIEHPAGEHCVNGPALWDCKQLSWWRPLTDDGDALRLAVMLSLRIEPYTGVVIHDRYPVANVTDVYSLKFDDVKLSEPHGLDASAATRRAIVRAAAEIGRGMK